MIELVPQAELTRAWLRCLPVLLPAIRRSSGHLDAASVLFGLHDGTFKLWSGRSGADLVAAVTMVNQHPSLRVFLIALLGGKRIQDWLGEVEAVFIREARRLGCDALECHVRPGLVGARYDRRRAVLKRWSPHWTMVRMPLPPE